MGQCLSSDREAPAEQVPRERLATQAPAPPAQPVLTDRNVYPTIQRGALQVAVSSARLAFGDGDRTPLLVRLTPRFAFIALFEGLGEHGSAVAAFCRSQVYELYQDSSVRHPGSPLEALRETVQRLDAAIFATEQLPHPAKAGSGAAALLALLDLSGQRVYCANVGAALCLLSRIAGSFNATRPEGFFLSAEHTTRNKEELVRLQHRAPGEATPPRAATTETGLRGQALPETTRALGFMDAKRQAGGSGALVCDAFVADHALSTPDQHLVLGSAAFWGLVGPPDAALRAHYHEKFARRELERIAVEAAAVAAGGGAPAAPSPSLLRATNAAEHLVLWALEKAGRRQSPASSQASNAAGPAGPPAAAGQLLAPVPNGRNGAASPGDLGVVVVTLRRQDVSLDVGLRTLLAAAAAAAARSAAAAKAGLPSAAGAGGGAAAAAGEGYLQRGAARRWAQIRMLVDFHKAHRRVLLERWWEAADALLRQSRTASPAAGHIHLLASAGKVADAAAAQGAARRLGTPPSKPKTATPPPVQAARGDADAGGTRGGGGERGIRAVRPGQE